MPATNLGTHTFYASIPGRGGWVSVSLEVSLYSLGKETFLEVRNSNGGIGNNNEPAITRLVFDGTVQEMKFDLELKRTGETLADILKGALGFEKKDGMWVPQAKPGDTLLIDKADRPTEIQVVSLEQGQTVIEKIEKKKLTVDQIPCVCPSRDLFSYGCRCAAKG